jgi:hypothetical protein
MVGRLLLDNAPSSIEFFLVESFTDRLSELFGSVRFACAVKLEDGAQHKNHRVFSVSTGEELIAFSQKAHEGWDLQYTISESHAIRLVGADIQVYRPAEWSKGIVDKLKVEGATSVVLSPGLISSVAVLLLRRRCAGTCSPQSLESLTRPVS